MQGSLNEIRLEDYDAPPWVLNVLFGVPATLFVLSCILLPYLVPNWVPHRVTLITSMFFYAFALSLVGPFFAPMNLTSMVVGLSLSSFFATF